MKRAIPVLLLTIAGLVPLWRYEPRAETTTVAAAEVPADSGAGSGSGSTAAGRVVAGEVQETRYGQVQVQLTYEGDRITAVTMLKQPGSAPTRQAVPVLVEETLEAQSAEVDSVSGATTTSAAYVRSLQSAIDSAE
ncbi:FMN-binding protein [Actinosynnema mirum]|uniref:FMN-binding domain protein n=1 Tax=Actinosynnema mirum (strain ATCC 29888 / DSM 43827 / JCM 3225 / NBRC 14064 / NCIMB 13271 / NRRL B-12336 / IMRU 3971 / 101) TaxID=446462 RepID=C6WGN2_ACTMD|nr:FMN-binding protein [Actinosynnema mirum]ACU34348.1 FMN-binding domain protein [Actinosynnema mirum DSM 43827]